MEHDTTTASKEILRHSHLKTWARHRNMQGAPPLIENYVIHTS